MSLESFKVQAIRDLNIYKATPTITDEEWIAFAQQLVASNSKTIREAKSIFLEMFEDKEILFIACESVDNTDLNALLMMAIQISKS
ncbi:MULTISPECIES: hypothetical protein [Acinetobacter]|uniref:hypothetical protein n=1 Tax=Acinetobacter TaxID=469 RepID=UPI0028137C4B|nr:hypothetical protein [Acinetobacter sp. 12966]MDQ9948650.1 hypothetical protein [Acinetobacter sp. 12966]